MRTIHSDTEIAGKMWITEASLYVGSGELLLSVKNSFNAVSQIDIDYKNFSCPQFVRTIVNSVNLLDADERLLAIEGLQILRYVNKL